MRRGVSNEVELVSAERTPLGGDPSGGLFRQGEVIAGNVAHLRAFVRVHEHDLGAEGAHHLSALGRLARGHDRDKGVGSPHTRSPALSRVTARQLDHRLPGPQRTRPLGILDHSERIPVLLGSARV
jgi:hypothetical protein